MYKSKTQTQCVISGLLASTYLSKMSDLIQMFFNGDNRISQLYHAAACKVFLVFNLPADRFFLNYKTILKQFYYYNIIFAEHVC